jgi:hypothetical protein
MGVTRADDGAGAVAHRAARSCNLGFGGKSPCRSGHGIHPSSCIDRLYVDLIEWLKRWGTQLVNIAKHVSPLGLKPIRINRTSLPVFYERRGSRAAVFR